MTALDTSGSDITAAPAQPKAEALPHPQLLPVTLIKANRYNPRKRIEPKAFDELVQSVERFGVLQPILVRPVVDHVPGEPTHEIVAGERRWRAVSEIAKRKTAKTPGRALAGPATIPVLVRTLTDYEAMEMATVENLQRADLHPIEEAEGFDMLLHPPLKTGGAPIKALSAEELAAKLGKSRSYVFGRLKLLSLTDKARDACFDGRLATSIALLIARVPADRQPQVLKECLQGYGNTPFTHQQAFEHIRRCYMLELARAPFPITDASLVVAAGSCRECPKRTGANPDLFSDVKSADVCTDQACFNGKVEAEQARKRAEAEAKGITVIDKPKPGEFMRLDEHDYSISGNKTIGQLLGKNSGVETVMVQTTNDGLVPAVRVKDAKAVLKEKGIIAPRSTSTAGNPQREAEERSKTSDAWRRAAAIECLNSLVGQELDASVQIGVMRLTAEACYANLGNDALQRMHSLHGSKPLHVGYDGSGSKELRDAVKAMKPNDVVRFMAAMAIADDLHLSTYKPEDKAADSRLRELCTVLGVDLDLMRNEITAERKAALKAKLAPKKKSTPKKAAKAAPTPKKSAAAKGTTKAPAAGASDTQ